MRKRFLASFVTAVAGLSLLVAASHAQEPAGGQLTSLRDVARKAVMSNPEVLSAYHDFQAAVQETAVARGGYLPSVDLEAAVGKENINDPRFPSSDFTRDRASLGLSQMIFDGFRTRNEVARLNEAARTRYNEVWEASEGAAADTTRAFIDVLRQRNLVATSEENYATHRVIYDQIERRVKAGISRRVDLEQASGRLALSESNLLTDVTNLHDVSMRYQRLVGELPAAMLEEPQLPANLLPATIQDTLTAAYANSPLMSAAISNVWSAEAASRVAKATMVPRFDLRARQDIWHDREDINGRYEDGVVELVMTYNLFNGGSDLAARRRAVHQVSSAMDLRDKVCRDIRQDVSISYNNVKRLEEQKSYLDRHQLAIEKAREAYRRQFDIGQRTLLDMLDTENEYYEARRAYLNAERDHAIAYARTLAGMGNLVAALQLGSDLHAMEPPKPNREARPDMYAVCPQEPLMEPAIDKEAIFREALQKASPYNTAPVAPAPDATPATMPATNKPAPQGW